MIKRNKYQKPTTEIIVVENESFICASPTKGDIQDWNLHEDRSGDDEWNDDNNTSNSK
ncbi:hypothetical protein [Prevotella sp. OH937_COT-195]|uniref:hypothetical protein n=1 Tax=Prevotella sp. OH937_COT-195 TaxID=2491051 RepID=UPI001315501C|nr:hypothetical protein [Prevotella sp. OH937_COT-195]